MPPVVHVVPHTHWDREWYHEAARFQVRLARMLDALVDELSSRDEVPTVVLDGQAILLADYVALRPDAAARLRHLLADGRLEAGPWYVLPDELLVSAEALVRNLLEGARTVRRYGGRPMAVGYSPDAFGHSGALPAILAGFGIPVAVVWRGFGGAGADQRDVWRWRAPDGSSVVMVHLPPPGYEYGANLPAGGAAAAKRWRALRSLLGPRARTPHWLLLNGADHHAAQAGLSAAVAALQAVAPEVRFRLGGLESYGDRLRAWLAERHAPLPEVVGELRDGRAHAWVLQGTHGSRLHLKQANAHAQRLLERVAEPLAALALMRGAENARADLSAAWRTLLENHAHDSICGTSADAVHREMLVRFARCRAQASEVIDRAFDGVIARDPDRTRAAGRQAWRPALLLFNPQPRPFTGVVEARVVLFRGDEPVGPGSGGAPSDSAGGGGRLVLRRADGTPCPVQELERRTGHDLVEAPGHYPDCDRVEWRRVAVAVRDLPPLGVAALAVEERPARRRGDARRLPPGAAVRVAEHGLDNGRLWVRVEGDGTLALADRETGRSVHGLGALRDEPDRGDAYTSSVPPRARVVTRPDAVAVRVVHAGPLRGELEVVRRYEATALEVTMRVRLDAAGGHVELLLAGVNRRSAHRLRVAFPLGERARRVVADGHFGPVERSLVPVPPRPEDTEAASPTAPMQRWVAVAGARAALAVLSDGLPQYEARPDGTVLVTAVRAFDALSKRDLPERSGHAGWPTPTPEGRCLGPFHARLGVVLAAPTALDDLGAIEAAAETFLAHPYARMQRALLETPQEAAGPTLEGAGLVLSAVKPTEEGRAIVLRCYNATAGPARGCWRLPFAVREVARCRLDETPLATLDPTAVIAFEASPREIVTFRVVPR